MIGTLLAMSATRESKALFLRSGGMLADSRKLQGRVCLHVSDPLRSLGPRIGPEERTDFGPLWCTFL